MKTLFIKLALIGSFILIVVIAGFFSHADRISMDSAIKYKHELLDKTPKPRIIFMGGSNARFGLISSEFRDSLKINPINTAIAAGVGLKLIIDDIKPYLKKNDVIIISPEYLQFYGDYIWGNKQLSQMISICPEDMLTLNLWQWKTLIANLPKTNIAKLIISGKQILNPNMQPPIPLYESIDGMNKFGDTDSHWKMSSIPFPPEKLEGDYNAETLELITNLNNYVTKELKGKLFFTYPSFAKSHYILNKKKVDLVNVHLKASGIPTIGNVQDFVYPDSLFFNSAYHLNKAGAEIRTKKIISELKNIIHK